MSRDPRLSIGANGGPPLDDPPARVLDPRLVALAHRGCRVIALLLEEQDATRVLTKRSGGKKALVTRKVWLFAMQRFVPQWMLAEIAGIDRGTVAQDQRDIAAWMDRNGMVRSMVEAVLDATEPLPAFIDDASDFLDECLIEQAIKRVKAAADLVSTPPPSVVSLIREGKLTHKHACALYGVKPAEVERWVRLSA